jgi:hypothetical protein
VCFGSVVGNVRVVVTGIPHRVAVAVIAVGIGADHRNLHSVGQEVAIGVRGTRSCSRGRVPFTVRGRGRSQHTKEARSFDSTSVDNDKTPG